MNEADSNARSPEGLSQDGGDLAESLSGPRNARKVPHHLDRAGYAIFSNDGQKDGRWKLGRKNAVIYVKKRITTAQKYAALRAIGANP